MRLDALPFTHLHVHSPYSFLDGASSVEDLVARAADLKMPALAITDHDSLCAVVRFASRCQTAGIAPILGVELSVDDLDCEKGPHEKSKSLLPPCHLTLLACSTAGYVNLCRLISLGHIHGGRLSPRVPLSVLAANADGLICLSGCLKSGPLSRLVQNHRYEEAQRVARDLLHIFGSDNFFVELQDDLTPQASRVAHDLVDIAQGVGVKTVATNNVHHVTRDGFVVHDLLSCVHSDVTVAQPHARRPLNAERFLKSSCEMTELFAWHPDAVRNTFVIAERCASGLPRLPFGENIIPSHDAPDSAAHLRELTFIGARGRYGAALSPDVTARINHELAVIGQLGYADYLLLVCDIVQWTRAEGINCTGRGSAADSAVCYALRITDVDVVQRGLPFERFLHEGKIPDIDMDFPHDRRDEVFRHIQERHGADNVGMACTFFTFRARSAVRDLGKALGLPDDALDFFSHHLRYQSLSAKDIRVAFEKFSELKHYVHLRDRFTTLFAVCDRVADFPRHVGTHSSAVVISRRPLTEIAPLLPSAKGVLPIWALDKDDSETAGGIKFDVLSLRILSSVSDAVSNIQQSIDPKFDANDISIADPATYAMLQAGRAVGAFQLESAAQIALAELLAPDQYEHIVHSIGIIRPANSRGGTPRASNVTRYLAARHGHHVSDPVLDPLTDPILKKTYGVPLFQEQVDLLIAKFLDIEQAAAERFRKRLHKHEKAGTLDELQNEFIARILSVRPELGESRAKGLWQDIKGWGGFGFTEAHAASFAQLAVKTAYLSVHYPAAFFAGLLNWQPMGFWPANTLASEARRRGVTVLPVDINISNDKCEAVEDGKSLRLGLRRLRGIGEEDRRAILSARNNKPFASLVDFCARITPMLRRDHLEEIILSGAFDVLEGTRRRGLLLALDETIGLAQEIRSLSQSCDQQKMDFVGPVFSERTPCADSVTEYGAWKRLLWTWRLTGVCADVHPLTFLRPKLLARGVFSVAEARECEHGEKIMIAGLNLRPHRPPTRSGQTVLFTEIEDETSHPMHVVCTGDEALDRCTATILLSPAVIAEGTVDKKRGAFVLQLNTVRPLRF